MKGIEISKGYEIGTLVVLRPPCDCEAIKVIMSKAHTFDIITFLFK